MRVARGRNDVIVTHMGKRFFQNSEAQLELLAFGGACAVRMRCAHAQYKAFRQRHETYPYNVHSRALHANLDAKSSSD